MGDLVSIIMPSYNTAKYIKKSIESVIKQTYQDWELIIVDDNSVDNTDDVVRMFLNDKRINYLKNEKNMGAAFSRNRALREARGKWIAFLDSDDLWDSKKLEKQIRFMEKNRYYFSYTKYQEIDENGEKLNIEVSGPNKITKMGMYNYCWPGCLTVMYNREKIGLVQIKDIKKNNDYAMWLKICKKENCYLLDENLAQYRRGRKGSISSQKYCELIKWHYRLYNEIEGMNSLWSGINTIRNIIFGIYKKKKFVYKLSDKNIKNYKIGICGHYGGQTIYLDGQTIKTKILTEELMKKYENKIKILDTVDAKKRIVIIFLQLIRLFMICDNIVILPAQNGIKFFVPLMALISYVLKRKMHYIVIGGWLPKYLDQNHYLKNSLKKFDAIYVETSVMKEKMEKQGFTNIVIMPNCKNLKILGEEELISEIRKPYKLCTFSRVLKEKGIEDIIEAVKIINKNNENICTLDIYGQIDKNYKERFQKISIEFPTYIKYMGEVEYSRSVDILKDYTLLVFPTKFYTEGIPGTIIDAYAAGLPVVSSRWESFNDIIDENKTGLGYEFNNFNDLVYRLNKLLKNPNEIKKMKKESLYKAKNYLPEEVIKILLERLL